MLEVGAAPFFRDGHGEAKVGDVDEALACDVGLEVQDAQREVARLDVSVREADRGISSTASKLKLIVQLFKMNHAC